ncbi:MAG TPA: M23 family metallopeptidase [Longimicrobiaceae bacterium]|nr:M23 family metallopeptidase [Longimicrobiaceae bacterium]
MIASRLLFVAPLLVALVVEGCDSRQHPIAVGVTRSSLPSPYPQADVEPEERGCATFEFHLRGKDQMDAVPLDRPKCGSLLPILIGAPTFDNQTRTVRLPIAFDNTGSVALEAPARLLGWEDSLVVVAAPGLTGNRHNSDYLRFVTADSQIADTDSALNGALIWRYDDHLASPGQPHGLMPGQRSQARWIELTVHPGVAVFRVTFQAVARRQTESTTEFVGPDGKTIVLPGFAMVTLQPQSFASTQKVVVSATSTEETRTDFTATAEVLFDAGPRMPHELRINTGAAAPTKDVEVHLSIPESFLSAVEPGYRTTVFGQWLEDGGSETLDVFDVLPGEFETAQREARFVIPAALFTDRRTPDSSYEAVVVLGTRPALTPLVSPSGGSELVALALGEASTCEAAQIGLPLGSLRVTGNFNPPQHKGTDYRAATGTPVFASAGGVVERIGWDSRPLPRPDPRSGKMVKGWGRYVRIRHSDGTSTLYAHLVESSTADLGEGQSVTKGQMIALANNSGGSSASHLHIEYVTRSGERIDPHPCIVPDVTTYRGYWTRTGDPEKRFNSFEATVTRAANSASVRWVFLPTDSRYAPARLEGDKVVWEYTQVADTVTHRLKVAFDANGCVGTWHHDHHRNNFFQNTDHSTCRVYDPSKPQPMVAEPPTAPSDSAGRAAPLP